MCYVLCVMCYVLCVMCYVLFEENPTNLDQFDMYNSLFETGRFKTLMDKFIRVQKPRILMMELIFIFHLELYISKKHLP